MRTRTYIVSLLLTVCAFAAYDARAQEQTHQAGHPTSHDSNGQEMDAMTKRGDNVMGFDQKKTTHHFLLKNYGGVIQVEAKDVSDEETRDKIRMHLSHIAVMFTDGNFKAPMLIHAQTPPGVTEMKSSKGKIEYEYVKTEGGGQVEIRTTDAKALKAVHEFLRFQIKEHQTGDPVDVK